MVIVETSPVVVVGGGTIGPEDLSDALRIAKCVVAADGGAGRCLDAGIVPDAVIGDLDSIGAGAAAAFSDRLYTVSEQETTDFEKCLMRIATPLVIAVGFTGGRVDHVLAVLNVMARRMAQKVVLLGTDDVSVIVPEEMIMELKVGTRVSLLPLGPARCSTGGLRWDLTDAQLAPDGMISISNEVAALQQRVKAAGPVLLSVPRDCLDQVIKAL